jgi:hypothetical protein
MSIPVGYSLSVRIEKQPGAPRVKACKYPAPCGQPCVLRGDVKHTYHACKRETCEKCRGYERFGVRK